MSFKYLLAQMHIIINYNNMYFKKISKIAVYEHIALFRKYAIKRNCNVDVYWDDELFEDYPNIYSCDDNYIYLENIAIKNWMLEHYFMCFFKGVTPILADEDFQKETLEILKREKLRQLSCIYREKYNKTLNRIKTIKDLLDNPKKKLSRLQLETMEEKLEDLEFQSHQEYLNMKKFEFKSCDHLFAVCSREYDRFSKSHKLRHKCLKCELTDEVRKNTNRPYESYAALMYDETWGPKFEKFIEIPHNNPGFELDYDDMKKIYDVVAYHNYYKDNELMIEDLNQEMQIQQSTTSRKRGGK